MKELFKQLTAASCAPSGEGEVRRILRQALEGYVDEMRADRLGNFIATKHGRQGGPVLMLSAHMDEIGLMVSHIEPSGIIRFEKLGWIDDRVLPTQLVTVVTRQGKVPGVIGRPSASLLTPEENKGIIPFRKLFVDIGSFSRQETEQQGVRLGDLITFRGDFLELENNIVVTKSVDDRTGLTAMVAAMRSLDSKEHEATVVAVGLSQHEVGLRGARTAAYNVHPDVAIHIDVTGHFPDVTTLQILMGKGPIIRLMEDYGTDIGFGAQRGVFCSRAVTDLLIETAQRENIPSQVQIKPGIINDEVVIHTSREGVLTGYILIPARYLHSAHELVKWDDVEDAVRLVAAFARAVSGQFVEAACQLE
jgi:putative aminopeptidase FrvX